MCDERMRKDMKTVYPSPTVRKPLVLSMSAIALFRKCRRAYRYGYEDGLVTPSSPAAELGTDFHELMKAAAAGHPLDQDAPMYAVAEEYLRRHPLPDDIISAEEGLFTQIVPKVWLRTTFDLVYRDADGWIVGRDYKTFEKSPAYDVDLDFQGRIYIAALMRAFDTDRVRFEYEYVRRSVPGTKNSRGFWEPHECYINMPVVISRREADELWDETILWVKEILRARKEGLFMRSGTRKEFSSPCLGCFYETPCKTEMSHGELDDQDIELLGLGRRERDTLPAHLLGKKK